MPQPHRLVVHGAAGRMGCRVVAGALADPERWRLVAAIERAGHPRSGDDAAVLAGCPAAYLLLLLGTLGLRRLRADPLAARSRKHGGYLLRHGPLQSVHAVECLLDRTRGGNADGRHESARSRAGR